MLPPGRKTRNKFTCKSDEDFQLQISRGRSWFGCLGIRVMNRAVEEHIVEIEISRKQTKRLIRRLQESL